MGREKEREGGGRTMRREGEGEGGMETGQSQLIQFA